MVWLLEQLTRYFKCENEGTRQQRPPEAKECVSGIPECVF